MGRPKQVADFVVEEGKKFVAKAAIAGAVAGLLMLWAPFRDRVVAIWHSPDQLQMIFDELREMRGSLDRATGDDRVIRQVQGQSYVAEPVHHGDTIILNLTAHRTRLGASCRLVRRTGLFTDGNGVVYAGPTAPATRQLGSVPERIRLELEHPVSLPIGRVEVRVALEFDCGGEIVFDQTDIVIFQLLPPRENAHAP